MKLCLALILIVGCGVSRDQESQLGHNEAAQVDSQLPILRDAAVAGYVNDIGTTIARTTSRADLDWHFAVVNTDLVNAFALPGGYIYVNRGLIARAANESELASVLGHEIEHVVRRHAVRQIEKAQGARAGVAVVCRLTSICDNAAGQIAIQIGGAAVFARFSRADEIQADSGGFDNMIRAGYNPRGMLTMFERLLAEEQRQPELFKWFADHPGTGDRIAYVQHLLDDVAPQELQNKRTDSPRFQMLKRRLAALPAPPPPPPVPQQ